jgi:7,8-dihydropterin-6-yl-methyl-4-(beta-D-ribofuranosyl)aminobenzene 5'-phosphate synthase
MAAMERATLVPVDRAEVTVVVDNSLDMLLPSTDLVRRAPLPYDCFERDPLRAEHGYALLLTTESGGERQSILYDAGLGRDTAVYNLDILEVRPTDLRAIVLSHGHADHHAGLEGVVRRLGRPGMPLVLHPDAWRERRVTFPTGTEIHMPGPSQQDLDREGWQVVEERGPSLLLDGAALVTGQVERVTDFEKGFPIHQARTAEGWEADPWIWDDQALVVNLRGQGLVVVSSCSHAGIINVLSHARQLTGVDQIHACVGGMHLTGGLFESIIPPTVEALVGLAPRAVVPGHCTGWRAQNLMVNRLPEAYIQSNVGTRLHFAA